MIQSMIEKCMYGGNEERERGEGVFLEDIKLLARRL